jgi:hypothetical protein
MTSKPPGTPEFSIVLDGPLYRLYQRGGLLTPPLGRPVLRMVIVCLISWLPLFLLSWWSGSALGGARVPFLLDLELHARLLAALPLLIGAEVLVHERIKGVVRQFLDRDLIAPEDQARFEGYILSANRLANAWVIEALLVVAAVAGYWSWRHLIALDVATWYAMPTEGDTVLTPAGYWYAFVSLPIFRFMVLRWYFRIFIWYRFVWQVARHIPLRLNALHPDQTGGLGFMSISVFAFMPVLQAHTVFLAGAIANHIWYKQKTLLDYQIDIVIAVLFLLFLVTAPLLFFVLQLSRAKRIGLREYGALGSRYVASFRDKWLEAKQSGRGDLLGSADVQSLADLSNSFEVVRQMHLLPIGRPTLLRLILLVALPLAPLVLTLVPLDQLISRSLGLLF